jgi:HD-GYP domain-containing protein (c-di-GMP phosphodiesterase class II)
VRERRPVSVDAIETAPDLSEEVGRLAAAGVRAIAPVISGDRAVALVLAGDRNDGQPLDRFDIEMLNALSHSIAVAVDNTNAFDSVQRSFVSTVTFLISTVEARTPFMAGHSERVASYAGAMARALDLREAEVESLRIAALLHDLGMLELHDDVLGNGPLTDEQSRAVHRGPLRAAEILQSLGQAGSVAAVVKHHQERWDGYGYPDRLKEEEIPLGARILAIANAFDAMCSNRPHRGAMPVNDALAHILEKAGTQFDPNLARRFVEGIRSGEFAVG